MKPILEKRTQPVSINAPSRSATKTVLNPLPEPTICPNCGAEVRLVYNSDIYGYEIGEWPYAYRCVTNECDSYVGLHPFTRIPLGTLANKVTRKARKASKDLFNYYWRNEGLTRTGGYHWLANALGIHPDACHFGWFDFETCNQVISLFKDYK